MEEIIRIKDKRKGRFIVDDIVLNGYGKQLGATGIAFYVVLCRYVNNNTQQAYPSLTKIYEETRMDRTTILIAAKRAEKLGLIKKEAIPGKYTIYTLLEPKRPNWWEIHTSQRKKVSTGGISTPTGGISTPTGGISEENELRLRTKTTGYGYKKLQETVENLKRPSLK